MGNLKEIVGIKNDQDFQQLVNNGTITYGEETIEYSDDAIYFTPEESYSKDEIDAKETRLQMQIDGIGTGLGVVDRHLNDVQANINAVNAKIPSTASATNQLADQDFVNSSVSTATATFRGTVNSYNDLPTMVDLNDYSFVKSTDSAGNTLYKRYKYDGTQWVFEYTLNNSSFTAEQWATINSGLTQGSIPTQLSQLIEDSTHRTVTDSEKLAWNNKSDFSGSYDDLSNKPNLFSGNYNDLSNKPTLFSGSYNDLTNKPTFATVATSGDYNDLTNKPTIPDLSDCLKVTEESTTAYCKLSNGLILQWGSAVLDQNNGTTKNIALKTPFANSSYGIVASHGTGTINNDYINSFKITARTKTYFTVQKHFSESNEYIWWVAIGF